MRDAVSSSTVGVGLSRVREAYRVPQPVPAVPFGVCCGLPIEAIDRVGASDEPWQTHHAEREVGRVCLSGVWPDVYERGGAWLAPQPRPRRRRHVRLCGPLARQDEQHLSQTRWREATHQHRCHHRRGSRPSRCRREDARSPDAHTENTRAHRQRGTEATLAPPSPGTPARTSRPRRAAAVAVPQRHPRPRGRPPASQRLAGRS